MWRSQRAFRDRKEKHAKCLQEKIGELETRLRAMDNVNTGLERQLAELRGHREGDYDQTSKPVSPQSEAMQSSPVIGSGDSRGVEFDVGEMKALCTRCRGRDPAIDEGDHRRGASDETPQRFLP